jgi:hypothetical protein
MMNLKRWLAAVALSLPVVLLGVAIAAENPPGTSKPETTSPSSSMSGSAAVTAPSGGAAVIPPSGSAEVPGESKTPLSSASSMKPENAKDLSTAVKAEIDAAKAQGKDVTTAQEHERQGLKALSQHNEIEALAHFKKAEQSLAAGGSEMKMNSAPMNSGAPITAADLPKTGSDMPKTAPKMDSGASTGTSSAPSSGTSSGKTP